jgi:hypothetical protein
MRHSNGRSAFLQASFSRCPINCLSACDSEAWFSYAACQDTGQSRAGHMVPIDGFN